MREVQESGVRSQESGNPKSQTLNPKSCFCQPCLARGRTGIKATRTIDGEPMCRACWKGKGDDWWTPEKVRQRAYDRAKRRRMYLRHRERELERQHARRRAFPECVVRASLKWRQVNRQRYAAYQREWKRNNREHVNAYKRMLYAQQFKSQRQAA